MGMDSHEEQLDLNGHLLLAMPGMEDPRFDRSVIFMCSHSAEGAMGLIINKPAPQMSFKELLKQLQIAPLKSARDVPIHIGGPVEVGRGFVLHTGEYKSDSSTLHVGQEYGMTATLDVLEDLARGQGPDRCILALGYAGWGPGQLEGEIQNNGWLTCPASPEIVFDNGADMKWQEALRSMGIDPLLLSAEGGHA